MQPKKKRIGKKFYADPDVVVILNSVAARGLSLSDFLNESVRSHNALATQTLTTAVTRLALALESLDIAGIGVIPKAPEALPTEEDTAAARRLAGAF